MKYKKHYFFICLFLSFVFYFLVNLGEPRDQQKNFKKGSSVNTKLSKTNDAQREAIIKRFNSLIKESYARNDPFYLTFGLDPLDSKTLCIYRQSTLKADEIQNWSLLLLSVNSSIDELKAMGFNKIRIYSSVDNYTNYSLKIL